MIVEELRTRPVDNIFEIIESFPIPAPPPVPVVGGPANTGSDVPAGDPSNPVVPPQSLVDEISTSSSDDIKLGLFFFENFVFIFLDTTFYFLRNREGQGVSIDTVRNSGKTIYGVYFSAKWSEPVNLFSFHKLIFPIFFYGNSFLTEHSISIKIIERL